MKEIEQSRMSHVLVKGTCMMVPWEPRMELVVGNDQLIFGYEFDRSTTLKLFEFPGPCHFSSVQFSRLVVSHSLRPHESQHAWSPCPSPFPGVHSNSCPSSQWCHPAISSSVVLFPSCPQSLPVSEIFPVSQLLAWGDQSISVSALASFLPKKS